ncbi:T9SS type A sorting domain-containing protein [Reichenbachiella ulvae]|uniref:T9SS type A sorting domain-containing protein n=1 Tax=Reichenbachiella ulvae TaxID=2980104 RepID=A0ABT3CU49_9BACT|nr:T9SS type A sorting domain-containing protein [Reichenbachiella ulvae]MCV9387222.1 T9SS type A sorting domain-containing protein [Reichenbachiella ulvae]
MSKRKVWLVVSVLWGLGTILAAREVISNHRPDWWVQEGAMLEETVSSQSFHLDKRSDGNYFVWSASEFEGAVLFEMQIKSAADADFRTLESWHAHQDSYEYKLKPHHLLSEYRLKVVGENEAVSYSETVELQPGEADELMLYPNPTRGNVKITGPEILSYQLVDVRGNVLVTGNPSANMEVEMVVSAELFRSEDGLYFLKCQTTHGSQVIQVKKI